MPYAGASPQLEFMELNRSAEDVQKYLDNPKAKALLFHNGRPALTPDLKPIKIHPKDLIGQNIYDPGPLFLGLENGVPLFAFHLADTGSAMKEDDFQELRMVGSRLRPADLAILGRARSFLDWHFNHSFCAKCGNKSRVELAGLIRKCPSCETEHYPRVNPVVIMLVLNGDQCLLGAGHNFPQGAYSTLAGFISPGETPEEAVIREVEEEVGITVKDPRYVFSQPWPFPSQLMMGFVSHAVTTDITVNKEELREAQWFSKDTVRAVFDKKSDAFTRPPRYTIAHHLLRFWLTEEG
jgi:NAD+ diphosphatase